MFMQLVFSDVDYLGLDKLNLVHFVFKIIKNPTVATMGFSCFI
ncbi:hypothetical protein HMPREF9378_1326 [Streptococcus sanguinis SK1 = NCTC 7863]|uniref:Uncharacterized protein n=3 Tax=Streptococcus sanguinis TaxID=1305 RepID=F0ISX5_STRSA|nr:hypothetical protein HMPREF9383_0585 [Streptococcus sanguinis SK150]EGD39452.1 hypothetical protein HMPREF9384_0937 [Streptococcus sanguinis SK160]EGF06905.1 hypothetical protein HMPREF9378_1326 [Streptococcus sanguinis SK1 = NCTC 7863]EGF09200.1 hypothetical protein HMPREF9394_0532 [Streptococcus sanguinis SK1057]EGF17729.1 hypothetical protein HMPREF9391_1849 [Streptococcus sanguinis SK408]